MRSIPTGARLFLAALLVYSCCPPFTSYDSYYVVPTALSLLRHGSTAVDEFVPKAPPVSYYAVECVPAGKPAIGVDLARGCPGGHYYNYFSPGVPVLATPVIALVIAATKLTHPLAPYAPHPIIRSFFEGDLVAGHAVAELASGALIGACAIWVMFHLLSLLLPQRNAIWLTLLYGLGTSLWSIGSRNLGQHGLTMVCLSGALYFAVRALDQPRLLAYAAVPLSVAVTVRPSNAVAALIFTLYVAVHCRSQLARFVAYAAPVAILFVGYSWIVRHALYPRYYNPNSPEPHPALLGFAMNWVSPSRGVLVFTPVFLFALAGIVLAIRRRWLFPLAPYVAAILLLHSVLISRYWGGHSYGPRYFSDMTPLFVFFLAPTVKLWHRRSFAYAFLTLALWGVFVHGRGATSIAANQWSAMPDVDKAKWRVWNWRDPQFLRGFK